MGDEKVKLITGWGCGKKKIYIEGFVANNLGDDLMIKCLAKNFPDEKFIILTRNGDTFKDCQNICTPFIVWFFHRVYKKFISWLNKLFGKQSSPDLWVFNKFERLLYKNNIVAIIGGSIIQNFNFPKYKSFSFPVFVIGANAANNLQGSALLYYKKFFAECSDCCVRDSYTKNLFADSGVRLAPDVVFSYPVNRVSKKKKVTFSVIDPKKAGLTQYREVYYNKMAEIAKYFYLGGYKIELVSFCQLQGDDLAVLQIKKLIEQCDIECTTIFYDGTNGEDVIYAIAESSYVIATRYHSFILAILSDTPFFPVIYNEKMYNYLKDIDYSGEVIKLNEIENLNSDVYTKNLSIKTNKDMLVKNAKMQFNGLENYLKNE